MTFYDDYRGWIYSGMWSALSGFALYCASFPEVAPMQFTPVTILYVAITFHIAIEVYPVEGCQ